MSMFRSCRFFCILVCLFLLPAQQAFSYQIPADWETFVESWLQDNPTYYLARQYHQTLKQKLDKPQRNKLIGSSVAISFNRAFGNDASLGTVTGIHKLIMAMEQNRLDDALKEASLMAVSKKVPLLGKYISALQHVHKGFQFVEKVIENDLYKSPAYTNLVHIVIPALDCLSRFKATEKYFPRRPDAWIPPPPFDQARAYGKAPYIPSFLIRFDPGSQEGELLASLRQHMIQWENVFYAEWSEKDHAHRDAVRNLEVAPLAAQVRSVYKQVLPPRELFNRFLMRIAAGDQWRRILSENLHYCYLKPAGEKITREASRMFSDSISNALKSAVSSAESSTKTDKQQKEEAQISSSVDAIIKAAFETPARTQPQTSARELADLIRERKSGVDNMLQKAIEGGLNVNEPISASGDTLLHVAAEIGSERIVSILLSRGANVNARDSLGETPLCRAATYDQENSHFVAARLLLSNGANANNRDANGDKTLSKASFGSKIARAIRDAGGYEDVSPMRFIEACQNGTVEVINDYIKAGGNVNESFSGISALMFAVSSGNLASVRALLNAGAQVNATDRNGMTALHWAALFNHPGIADLLLQKGARSSVKDNRGNTAGYYQYWKHGKNANLAAKLGYTVPRDRAKEQAASAKAFNEAFSALAMGMKMGLEETARQNQLRQQAAQKASSKKITATIPQSAIKFGETKPLRVTPSKNTFTQPAPTRTTTIQQPQAQPETVYWVVVDRQAAGGGSLQNSARIITGDSFPPSGMSLQISGNQWKRFTWVYGTLDANGARQYADKANNQKVSIPLQLRTEPAGSHGWVYRSGKIQNAVILTNDANKRLKKKPGYINPIEIEY